MNLDDLRSYFNHELTDEAANEIESLQAENARLTAELEMERECSARNDRNNFDFLSDCSKRNEKLTAEREANYIKWQEKYDKVKQERDELASLIKSLKSTGGRLSNIVYNIEQVKDRLPNNMQSDLKKLRKEWDSLMSELPETSLAKHDLEMKAQGCFEASSEIKGQYVQNRLLLSAVDINNFAVSLTKQAEDLTNE